MGMGYFFVGKSGILASSFALLLFFGRLVSYCNSGFMEVSKTFILSKHCIDAFVID